MAVLNQIDAISRKQQVYLFEPPKMTFESQMLERFLPRLDAK